MSTKERWLRKYPREAKFAGICRFCKLEIPVGAEIAWAPGREADHWNCYVNGTRERRAVNEYRTEHENSVGIPARAGLSDRARKDLEAVQRGHERTQQHT